MYSRRDSKRKVPDEPEILCAYLICHLGVEPILHRQANCSADPTGLKFELVADHIPKDFLQIDVKRDDQRHLIFATPDQLQILAGTNMGHSWW